MRHGDFWKSVCSSALEKAKKLFLLFGKSRLFDADPRRAHYGTRFWLCGK
jgi:hypothetical protein